MILIVAVVLLFILSIMLFGLDGGGSLVGDMVCGRFCSCIGICLLMFD